MTTIMSEYHSGDRRGRHCDAKCHNASQPACDRICGGRYHGKGDQAQEQLTRDWLGDDWHEKKAAVDAASGRFEVVVGQAMQQALSGLLPS